MGRTRHTPQYRFAGQRRRKGRSPADDPACHVPCQPAYTVTFAAEASITPRVPFLNHSVGTTVQSPPHRGGGD